MQLKTGQTIMGGQVCYAEAKTTLFKGLCKSDSF